MNIAYYLLVNYIIFITMRKQRIRLSEATLHNIIRKCVNEAVKQQKHLMIKEGKRFKKRRIYETSAQQTINVNVNGENINLTFNELKQIDAWYRNAPETLYVRGDFDEEIPVDITCYIDFDNLEDSTFMLNDNPIGPETWKLDGTFSDNPLSELIGVYKEYGDNGKRNVSDALQEYLDDGML